MMMVVVVVLIRSKFPPLVKVISLDVVAGKANSEFPGSFVLIHTAGQPTEGLVKRQVLLNTRCGPRETADAGWSG